MLTSHHAGRRADRSVGTRVAVTSQSLIGRMDAVTGGRMLVLFSCLAAAGGSVLLGTGGRQWAYVVGVMVALIGLLAVSVLIDWSAHPPAATAAFPVAVIVVYTVLGVMAPEVSGALSGALICAYLYTGLTQRRGSSAWVVPLGGVAFTVMNGGLSHPVIVRLLIGAVVWTAVVEVVAAFVAEQGRLNVALSRAASSDALTGVPNRRDLDMRLLALRPGDAVVLCDLDHFKGLNDSRGHQLGDVALAGFGALLRTQLRADDYCARYGGDEFVLLLPETDESMARTIVHRMRAAWQLMDAPTTFTAGIAVARHHRDPAATMAAADAALYHAKAQGRNTVQVAGLGD